MRHKDRRGTHRGLVGNHSDEFVGIAHIEILLPVMPSLINAKLVHENPRFGHTDGIKCGQNNGNQQANCQHHPPKLFPQPENDQKRRNDEHWHKLNGILEGNAPKIRLVGYHFLPNERQEHKQVIGFQNRENQSCSQSTPIKLLLAYLGLAIVVNTV